MNTQPDTPKTTQFNTIAEYLKTVGDFMSSGNGHGKNFFSFVREHGRLMGPAIELPELVEAGETKECFRNAAWLALSTDGEFTYCEGYAAGFMPVLHAWVINGKGEVIDNTWCTKRVPRGREYYGIPFRHNFLLKMLARNRVYGLIDAPPKFELLHMEDNQLAEAIKV